MSNAFTSSTLPAAQASKSTGILPLEHESELGEYSPRNEDKSGTEEKSTRDAPFFLPSGGIEAQNVTSVSENEVLHRGGSIDYSAYGDLSICWIFVHCFPG